MFALASQKFAESTQTFVRQHGRLIAPGSTVFVSMEEARSPILPGPHLYLGSSPAVIADGQSSRSLSALSKLRSKNALIASFLQDHDVTVMMAEFGGLGCKLLPAAQTAGCAYYVHFHGYDASRVLNDPKMVRNYNRLFERAQGFFAPSRFLADKLIEIGCPPDAISVAHCGIEPDLFPLSRRLPQKCIAVGRFVEKKAPLISISAFAAAAKNQPHAHLDFVGDGPLLADCRDYVAANGLANKVTLHGMISHDQVQHLMSTASIFLQHSVTAADGDTEGLPVAILEAMSSGLAVVSTRHSGIPEAVEEGRTGLLVNERDVTAMAVAIRALLTDESLVLDFGNSARTRAVTQFSAERSAKLIRERINL